MAKSPKAVKLDPKASRKASAVQRTAENKARRLAKHVKAHPNDAQSASKVGKPYATRKAPMTKGNFKTTSKYFDGAGRRVDAPTFAPVVKDQ